MRMAALVITPEIEAAAQQLAAATGTTPKEAVASALHKKVLIRTDPKPVDMVKVREILSRIQSSQIDRNQTDDQILGYDRDGIPEQPYLGH